MATAFVTDSGAGGTGALTSATPSPAVSGSDRYMFGVSCALSATPNAFKHSGSGGTDLTQVGSDQSLGGVFTANIWQLALGSSTPSSSYTAYSASGSTAHSAAYFSGVDQTTPSDTPQTNSGTSDGVSATTVVSITATGLTSGDLVEFGLAVGILSGPTFVSVVADNSDTTLVRDDPGTQSGESTAATAMLRGVATGSSLTLSATITVSGLFGTIHWFVWALPLNAAAGGPNEYEVSASQAVDVGDSSSAQNTVAGAATQATDVGDSSTSQAVVAAASSQAVDVGDASTAQNTVEAAAAQAVDVSDAASAQNTVEASAAQSVDVGDSATDQAAYLRSASDAIDAADAATIQNTVAADATQAVDVGDAATAVSGSDLLAADGTDLGDSAANAAVLGEAVSDAVDVGDAATNQAVVESAAADAADMGDSATSAMAGGNVYDVDAVESMGLDVSATAPGIFSVEAADGIDVGDLGTSAAGATGDLEEKIDALTLLVQQLAQDIATAKTFYVGGPDHNDYERRELLRNYDRGVDIKAQNAMLMQMFKAIVNRDTPP